MTIPDNTPAKFVNRDGTLNEAALIKSYCELEKRFTGKPVTIIITVEGGQVQAVNDIPVGVKVHIWDFDTEGLEEDRDNLKFNNEGAAYTLTTYEGGAQ